MSFSSGRSRSPVLAGRRSKSPVLSGGRSKSPSSSSSASYQNGDSADGVFSRNRGASTGSHGTPKGKHKRKASDLLPGGPPAEQSTENFFDFTINENTDVWEENFASTLRRQTVLLDDPKFEATPIIPDVNVETIGGAYVEEERVPTLRRRGGISPATSGLDPSASLTPIRFRAQTDTSITPRSGHTTSPTSSLSSVEFDKLRKLEREIEDLKIARWKKPLIPDTINRLLSGQSCCLEWYKSMEEKRALLDAAVETNDGNCITTILLFLKRSVDERIFLGIVQKRRLATKHYVAHLKQFQRFKELETFYRRLNDYESLGYFKLEQCQSELSPPARIEAIKACSILFKNKQLALDQPHVEEYVKLTEKQKKIEEADGHGNAAVLRANTTLFTPLTTTLLYCCRFHKNEPEGRTTNHVALKNLFNVSEKQYFQVYLVALCATNDWSGVETLVTSKGVFGFGKKKKSPIGFERVVKLLSSEKYRAPDHVITKYLNEVEDVETRLQLATDAQLFDVGLECLKLLRDKERVESYINSIPPNRHRDFRDKINRIAKNSQIKWIRK